MNKVIILSRVSTGLQDLVQQTQEILKQVYRDGHTDEEIILIEDKESGVVLKEDERHGLNELKRYLESDESIKSVYIYELSRLSRRQTVLYSIRDYLIEKHIQLVCLKPFFKLLDIDGSISYMSSIIFSIYSTLSESETRRLKDRLSRGRKYNKKNGKTGGGVPLFGYTIDKDKRYIIHPEESKIIKRIFYEYTYNNKSLRTISKELKDEGLFPNTTLDTLYGDIQKWTKNDKYLGISWYPQIISNEDFRRCQKLRFERTNRIPIGISKDFLLSGLIIDIDVNRSMNPKGGSRKFRRVEQYSSDNKVTGEGHSITKQKIDPIVWKESMDLYKEYIVNKDRLIGNLLKQIDDIEIEIKTINKEKVILQNQIDDVEERLIFGRISKTRCERITNDIETEIKNKDFLLNQLYDDIDKKQSQIEEIKLSKVIDFDTLSMSQKKEIVNKVIDIISFKRIDVHSSIIHIYTKCNDKVIIYQINRNGKNPWVKIGEETMTPKEKPIKNLLPKSKICHTYKGDLYTTENKNIFH